MKYSREKIWIHEMHTKKNFKPTKYSIMPVKSPF